MANRLKGKIALITGATSGIGLSTARLFAQEGAYVLMADAMENFDIPGKVQIGNAVRYFQLDVTRPENWKILMETILKDHGHLDILVNNATSTPKPESLQFPENVTIESWDRSHSIQSDGVFLGCKFGVQTMRDNLNAGSIINVSTQFGTAHLPNSELATSRIALSHLSKSVALYCAQKKYPIRCNSVRHSGILTEDLDAALGKGRQKIENFTHIENEIPLHRLGRPEEVASVILFLASDECPFMTGADLVVDGGLNATRSSDPAQEPQKPYVPRAV